MSQGSSLGPLLFLLMSFLKICQQILRSLQTILPSFPQFAILIFSHKLQKISHSSIYFNNNPVDKASPQKQLGVILLTKLNFQEHIKRILTKVSKTIGLLRKLQNILPRESLLTIFKSFVRSDFGYGDIIYDQSYNNNFHQKMESMQYNAALAVVAAIKGSSRETLYL